MNDEGVIEIIRIKAWKKKLAALECSHQAVILPG